MNTPRSCPKCGSTLAPDAPEGLCPACLMAGALPTDATIKLTPSQMRTPSHGPATPSHGPATPSHGPATPSHGPATPPPEELAPLFPQLEIIELLGRGGMGAVYKARQPKLNRFVALKIISGDAAADPHFAERFQREAQALAKLNHPNIVSVFDFGETGGLFYFLMEFVDGANLRTLMQSGEMKPEAALALIPAFCDALQYAHDEGVVHRDIKPENVLVDKKGRLKIADFGLAKLTGSDAHDHTLTRTGMYLGTPRYMAPEQVEKPETVDHRADIYSLGVVFYEMLTGELPMGRFDPPSRKVQVDVKLDDIVLRSLEKDVDRRYQHASEIKTAVQSMAGVLERMPVHMKRMMGWEHRSKRTIFGLPLLHIAFGLDPATGQARTAKGIIAIGDRACGVLAFGGQAYGGIVFGGIGVGVVSFSGLAFGLISMGGLALGLLLAYGGLAAAPFALGGVAAGWVAGGGMVYGGHVHSGPVSDPLAKEFFQTWIKPVNVLFYTMLAFGLGMPLLGHLLSRRWARGIGQSPDLPSKAGAGQSASHGSAAAAEPRLSRAALIGAIWALFGFIAVIPSLMLSKTVELSEGSPSGSVYEQPPVAFTVFMVLLFIIGAGAPIGTTILGAISMNKIKNSGGKLYGLPLAFADTVFFPMLLLHGAMAVMLGLLIVTIMKMAGVNAGLGAAEMGLLAMLPLFADFFIVRALWRKVAGTAGAPMMESRPANETPAAAATKPSPRHLLSSLLVLLCLFGFFFGFGFQAKHSGSGEKLTKIITVGALDPLYFSESGPWGFRWGFNLFSWSFFTVVVAGIAFSALWRIGREDQGKVPRDPAWWRDWWKQVGIWGGLLLIVCTVRTVMHPEKVLQPPGDRAASTKNPAQKLFSTSTPRIVADTMGALEPEQYRFRYQIHTPPDHRVIVWMETTRNGKPVVIPGLANNISTSTQLGIGERFDGDAEFSLVEGSRITPDSKGKWRWDFKHGTVGKNTHRISPGGWIDNPFAGMSISMHQGPKLWEPKPGEEVSILVICGGSHSYSRDPTEEPPAGEIELRLKARIDPVPLFHRVQGSVGSSLRDPFPTPYTPLGQIAAGFRIDPNLPEDEIRRQMIAELTSNDSKRTNAEAILKSVGKPVTHETKPEDVLKALEDVAQTAK